MTKAHRLVAELRRLNPQAQISNGRRHYVIKVNGKLVGILPYGQAKEGLDYNLRSQLRRAGLTLPTQN